MSILLNFDPQTQKTLEEAFGENLPRAALEALVAEGYRSEKFSRHQVQQLLGLPHLWATEAWLKQHEAFPHTTLQDILHDSEISRTARET